MTPEEKYEISIMASECHDKAQRLDAIGAANIHGRKPEERLQIEIQYQIAKTEWLEAVRALQRAQERIAAKK